MIRDRGPGTLYCYGELVRRPRKIAHQSSSSPACGRVLIKTSQNGKPQPRQGPRTDCYSAAEFERSRGHVRDAVSPIMSAPAAMRSQAKILTFVAACTGPRPAGAAPLVVKAEGQLCVRGRQALYQLRRLDLLRCRTSPATVISLSKNAEYVGPCSNLELRIFATNQPPEDSIMLGRLRPRDPPTRFSADGPPMGLFSAPGGAGKGAGAGHSHRSPPSTRTPSCTRWCGWQCFQGGPCRGSAAGRFPVHPCGRFPPANRYDMPGLPSGRSGASPRIYSVGMGRAGR